jgi:secretion/DNA translocation related TadE-like protein
MTSERGNVSILMTAVVVVSVLACTAVARLGAAASTKGRANTAADAAALAAADALALGKSPTAAFVAAQRVAAADGARVETCVCAGTNAIVTVTLSDAHAIARAVVGDEPLTVSRNGQFAHP